MAAKPNIPVTRKEMYLDVMTGGSSSLPEPITLEEMYLAKIAGMVVDLPAPVPLKHKFLAKIAGMQVNVPTYTTGLPWIYAYLAKAAGQDVEVPQPVTREEMYWFDYVSGQPAPPEREYTGAVPVTFTANGQPLLDYLISGNTVQSGTPSPDMPVDVVGCGVKTENLLDIEQYNTENVSKSSDGSYYVNTFQKWGWCIPTEIGKTYTVTVSVMNDYKNTSNLEIALCKGYRASYTSAGEAYALSLKNVEAYEIHNRVFKFTATDEWLTIDALRAYIYTFMISEGSTALPYEPYGYKIPISSAGQTTPVYLGEVETTRRIKKLVLTGEENITFASEDANRIAVAVTIPNMRMKTSEIGYCNILRWKNKYSQSDYNRIATATSTVFYMSLERSILPEQTFDGFISYLKHQYATGTPVTLWYVLEAPETGIVNEPLMKIGDYADTLSMEQAGVSIPTVNGENALDVLTTVKPSEVYIKYKGEPVAGSQTSSQSSAYAPAEVSGQSESIDDINSSLLGKEEETE